MEAASWLFEHIAAVSRELGQAAALLLPGAVLSAVPWLGVYALFRHGGVGSALSAMSASAAKR